MSKAADTKSSAAAAQAADPQSTCGACDHSPAYHDGQDGRPCRAWNPDEPGAWCACAGWQPPKPRQETIL